MLVDDETWVIVCDGLMLITSKHSRLENESLEWNVARRELANGPRDTGYGYGVCCILSVDDIEPEQAGPD
jgi:hypothetical protein